MEIGSVNSGSETLKAPEPQPTAAEQRRDQQDTLQTQEQAEQQASQQSQPDPSQTVGTVVDTEV